jgi:membrane protein YqaA with SNARE-associated domain
MNPRQPGKHTLEEKTLEVSAHATLSLWGRIQRVWFRWADINQHAHWFPFLIGAIVAADAIIVLLPGDVLVVLAVMSNPKAWRKTMGFAALGGALGGFILFLLVRNTGGEFLNGLQAIQSGLGATASWEHARNFFREYGVFSIAIGSVIPLFSWPPVILAGLAQSDILFVLLCLLIGRFARYLILCYGVRYGWAFFQTVKAQAREERAKALGESQEKGAPPGP